MSFSYLTADDQVGQKNNPLQSRVKLFKDNRENLEDFYEFPSLRMIESEANLLDLNYDRVKKPEEKIRITIPRGSSTLEAADILDQKNLVERETFLEAVVMFKLETDIKSGSYVFTTKDDIIDIFEKILIKRR